MQPIDDSSMWHQQQQEEQQWLEREIKYIEREYDIAFGSFAKDFKQFVAAHRAPDATDGRPITAK